MLAFLGPLPLALTTATGLSTEDLVHSSGLEDLVATPVGTPPEPFGVEVVGFEVVGFEVVGFEVVGFDEYQSGPPPCPTYGLWSDELRSDKLWR